MCGVFESLRVGGRMESIRLIFAVFFEVSQMIHERFVRFRKRADLYLESDELLDFNYNPSINSFNFLAIIPLQQKFKHTYLSLESLRNIFRLIYRLIDDRLVFS